MHTKHATFNSSGGHPAAGLHQHGLAEPFMFTKLRASDSDTPLRIGRSDKCEITIKGDTHVSRIHAVIEPAGSLRWRIRELDSTNGLFVRGHRVKKPILLITGMSIRMGNTRFTAVDLRGLVPITATRISEFCCVAKRVYGSLSAAARKLGVTRDFVRKRGQHWECE